MTSAPPPSDERPRIDREALPIDDHLPALIAALKQHRCAALRAPTGAGKTTRVPPALWDAGLSAGKQIVLLQPRRLAARAAAARMSMERGTVLGGPIGYEVRFDRRRSPATQILVVTDGVFLRMLQDDPFLERVGIVLFDEFHERNLNCDLALAMVRRVQREVRPDLKIVVMSATLAAEPIAKYLDGAPIVESHGRLFPVAIEHVPHSSTASIWTQAAQGVEQVLTQTSGDVLVFLPGVGEIRRTADELSRLPERHNLALMELYGDLPLEREQAVLAPAERRKVVLSTNVAETSLTIEGITGVVDAGWARVLRRDPQLGINRLELERISKAAADQRAGRAGRTAPGACLRLWTRAQQQHLPDFDEPEIRRVDLAGPVLELLAWGEPDPLALGWFEPPSADAVQQAIELLRMFGAVGLDGLTTLGRAMARLPVHPRIARMMLEGARLGHTSDAGLVGAMLSERDPWQRANRARGRRSELLDRLAALQEFERTGRRGFEFGEINAGAAKFVLRARDQLLRMLGDRKPSDDDRNSPPLEERELDITAEEAIQRAVAAAFLDRLARRREPNSTRAVIVGGRGVRFADGDSTPGSQFFVCVDLSETGGTESQVRLASEVQVEWLPPELLGAETEIEFDPQRERIVALRRTRFHDLIVDEAATNIPPDADPGSILAREAASRLDLSQLLDAEAAQFVTRVGSLVQWMPELALPHWGDELLGDLLSDLCRGRTSLAELRQAPLLPILRSRLTPAQSAAIDREAPEHIVVPSGSRIALEYQLGKPPVLAVRIQEIFGLRDTPRIAGGRVPVVLHLLAPNYRPQQITTDLASFWRTAYHEVRKELRRRYPKHAWPDDPLTAQPERRPQRKRSG